MESTGDFCYLVKWLWVFWTFWGSELQNTSWPCWNVLLITWILWCLWKHGVVVLDRLPPCTENSTIDEWNWVKCGGNPFHWMFGHTPEFLIKDGHPFQLSCLVFPLPPKEKRNNHKDARRRTTTKDPGGFGRGKPHNTCGMCNSYIANLHATDTSLWGKYVFFTKRPQGHNKNPWKIIAMLNFMPFCTGRQWCQRHS